MAVTGGEAAREKVLIPLKSGGRMELLQKGDPQGEEPAPGDGIVRVVDDRYEGNPSFQIRDSFLIRSRERKREILDVLIAYNSAHPTNPTWNRTIGSLEKEWNLHNLAYRLHVYRKSARHVDLDNRDEGRGYLHFFITGFFRVLEKMTGIKKRP